MEFKGSRTEDMLQRSFNGEIRASARYRNFGDIARMSGLRQVSDIFEAIAANEVEHARHAFNFLGWGGNIQENLESAIQQEHLEATNLYVEAAQIAASEGFPEIAEFFKHQSVVEGKHEKLFREVLEKVKSGELFDTRTVGHSAVTMMQVVLPEQANPAGFIHGGELMKFMDNAAGVAAVRHARTNVVTARVEEMDFKNPVRIGSLVIAQAKLIFTSRSSMWIHVRLDIEQLPSGEHIPAMTANFIMVALDSRGKPTRIPQLIISTEEEEQLYNEARQHYEKKKRKGRN